MKDIHKLLQNNRDWADRIDRELRDRFEHWHRLGYVELHA